MKEMIEHIYFFIFAVDTSVSFIKTNTKSNESKKWIMILIMNASNDYDTSKNK